MLSLQNFKLAVSAVFFLLFMMNFTQPASAQFIDLRLKIESKFTAQTEQPLSFKVYRTNSGKKAVGLGNMNMGILSINALEDQVLLISMNKPEALLHQNSAIVDRIPINLSARYGYSIQNYDDSFLLKSSLSPITVKKDMSEGPWSSIYIFMFSSITVGDIAHGLYANDLILNVEYL
ncbi:MAG TPA: hypothetical protein VF181_12845 [Balneolaceae bacterium]